jgi:hypothetical protein
MSDKLRVGELVRKRPEPVPSIYPLPEYLAAGDRKDDYENTKAVLQVPWMGVVTMAFSHYRKFYRTLWPGLRPLFQSAELVACCGALRSRAEELADELSPAPLAEQLTGYGYAPRELQNIAEMIAIFHHGNFAYALLAAMARLLLEGQELPGRRDMTPFSGSHAPRPPFLSFSWRPITRIRRRAHSMRKSNPNCGCLS